MEPRDSIYLGDDRHASFAACWTSLDVEPDQLEDFFTTDLRCGLFRGGRFEQATASRDLLLSASVSEWPVVPDPYEAPG